MRGFSYLLSCVCDININTILYLNGVVISLEDFRFDMRKVMFTLDSGDVITIYEDDEIWSEYYPNNMLEIIVG